jgi:ABC-type cobalt transport system substrate-binding protein
MKELANSFAQLAAIIMLLVTLAVSTAAISQWGGQDGSATSATTQRAMPLSLDAR